jgi:hypothetical protein
LSYPRRVSNAGWYPDPSGQPGQYRYWDGSGWSAETAGHPSAPPPGSGGPATPSSDPTQVAPQQPTPGGGYGGPGGNQGGYGNPGGGYSGGGYGGGGYGGGYGGQQPGQPSWGGAPSGGSGGSGKTVGIVVGVIVLVIALGVGTFLLVRGLSGDDDGGEAGGGGDTSSRTESGTETETGTETPEESASADPTGLACAGGIPDEGSDGISDGTLSGGGLSVDQVAGFENELTVGDQTFSQDSAFDFADGMTTVSRIVTDGWVGGYGVGSLTKDRGYTDAKQAAETAMSCLEQSDNYKNVTRRDDLEAGELDVDGFSAYSLTSDILAEAPGGIPGDRVIITVVDTGDVDRFGLYINYVPLGYNDLLRTQMTVADTLGVN